MIKERVSKEELKATIRANPQRFDMDVFYQETECGTSYCIAGWACALGGYRKILGGSFFDIGGDISCEVTAKRLLNLERVDLFYEELWPQQLRSPVFSETPEEKVERACQAIDYFIK